MNDKLSKTALILGPGNKEGGVTTFVEELVRVLSDKNYNVCVITFNAPHKTSSYLRKMDYLSLELLFLPKDIWKCIKILSVQNFDITISNLYYSFLLPFCKSNKKVHIFHGFGKLEVGLLRFFVANISNMVGYIFSHKSIANSYLTASVNRMFGLRESKVVPWGIPKVFSECKADSCCRDISLLYVGRLYSDKGLDILLRSFVMISSRLVNDNISLHIAGDNKRYKLPSFVPDDEVLRKKLVFHGYKDKVELIQLYLRSRIFISLNLDEPFGFTYLEALACGTPIIAPKGCGIQPFVDDRLGLFIDVNEESLLLAIDFALSKNWNGKEIQQIVRTLFTWDKLSKSIFDD